MTMARKNNTAGRNGINTDVSTKISYNFDSLRRNALQLRVLCKTYIRITRFYVYYWIMVIRQLIHQLLFYQLLFKSGDLRICSDHHLSHKFQEKEKPFFHTRGDQPFTQNLHPFLLHIVAKYDS